MTESKDKLSVELDKSLLQLAMEKAEFKEHMEPDISGIFDPRWSQGDAISVLFQFWGWLDRHPEETDKLPTKKIYKDCFDKVGREVLDDKRIVLGVFDNNFLNQKMEELRVNQITPFRLILMAVGCSDRSLVLEKD